MLKIQQYLQQQLYQDCLHKWQIMVLHQTFSTFYVFPCILSMFSTAFYFLLVQLHGGKLRAELSELRASLGAQVYLKGKLSIIKPTLESVWKFTEITGTVDLKPFSVGCRWKWFMVETMISILSLCNDKWLGRSALEAKCSSLLDKAQFTEKSWWRYWARWLFGWFFPDACCH